jgi:Mg2+ and Co2+ transporter CorA
MTKIDGAWVVNYAWPGWWIMLAVGVVLILAFSWWDRRR